MSKFKVGDRVTWTDAYSVKRWGEIRSIGAEKVVIQEEGSATQWFVPSWQVETDIRAHVGGVPAAHPTADTGAKRDFVPGDLVSWKGDDCIKSGIVKRKDEVGWYVCVDEKDSEWIVRPSDMTGVVIPSYPNPTGASVTPNPKQVFGDKKPALAQLPLAGMVAQSLAHMDGDYKYDFRNWRDNPVEALTYVNAALRHLMLFAEGEELTRDTKLPNLGAVMACCAILLDAQVNSTLIDNRSHSVAAADYLHDAESMVSFLKNLALTRESNRSKLAA